MSKYKELVEEMRQIAAQADQRNRLSDPSDVLGGIRRLEALTSSFAWIQVQLLRELDEREDNIIK